MERRKRRLKSRPSLFLVFLLLGLWACDGSGPDVSSIPLDLKVKRLDQKIYSSSDLNSLLGLIDENREEMDLFYTVSKLPSDSILADVFLKRINNLSIDTFYQEYAGKTNDIAELEDQFEDFFKHLKYYDPGFNVPEISILFSALLDKDLVRDSSNLMISLDFFLGPQSKYRPRVPGYMLGRYDLPYLTPMFLGLLYSRDYNRINNSDRSLIAEMIFYGKAHYFASIISPQAPDSLIFGFNTSDMEYLKNSIPEVWAFFIERDLLFTNNFSEINRYVGERPKVLEIDPNCPGRVGRYLGYLIVKAFEENSGLSPMSIMEESDAQKIFRNSGFNPSKLPG